MSQQAKTLDNFLKDKGFFNFENGSGQVPQQQIDLIQLVNTYNVKSIMEIGFNAGHSADALLSAKSDVNLVSFDIATHSYIDAAKEFIDIKFPGRHKLIKGDSIITVPEYYQSNPNTKFDLIFIDGCHEFRYAMQDLMNCKLLSHPDTIVVLDDTSYQLQIGQWNEGPTLAWMLLNVNNIINPIQVADYMPGRGMSWGKYKTT